jgi:hypothetical protein
MYQTTLYLGMVMCLHTGAKGSHIICIKDWNVQFTIILH